MIVVMTIVMYMGLGTLLAEEQLEVHRKVSGITREQMSLFLLNLFFVCIFGSAILVQ